MTAILLLIILIIIVALCLIFKHNKFNGGMVTNITDCKAKNNILTVILLKVIDPAMADKNNNYGFNSSGSLPVRQSLFDIDPSNYSCSSLIDRSTESELFFPFLDLVINLNTNGVRQLYNCSGFTSMTHSNMGYILAPHITIGELSKEIKLLYINAVLDMNDIVISGLDLTERCYNIFKNIYKNEHPLLVYMFYLFYSNSKPEELYVELFDIFYQTDSSAFNDYALLALRSNPNTYNTIVSLIGHCSAIDLRDVMYLTATIYLNSSNQFTEWNKSLKSLYHDVPDTEKIKSIFNTMKQKISTIQKPIYTITNSYSYSYNTKYIVSIISKTTGGMLRDCYIKLASGMLKFVLSNNFISENFIMYREYTSVYNRESDTFGYLDQRMGRVYFVYSHNAEKSSCTTLCVLRNIFNYQDRAHHVAYTLHKINCESICNELKTIDIVPNNIPEKYIRKYGEYLCRRYIDIKSSSISYQAQVDSLINLITNAEIGYRADINNTSTIINFYEYNYFKTLSKPLNLLRYSAQAPAINLLQLLPGADNIVTLKDINYNAFIEMFWREHYIESNQFNKTEEANIAIMLSILPLF